MTGWTPARIETLKKLWSEGATGTQIGQKLGITRNAVIGKANRLGLAARAAPSGAPSLRVKKPRTAALKTNPIKAKEPEIRIAPEPTWPVADVPASAVSILELKPKQCRFPHDKDGGGYQFCGQPVDGHRTYCAAHKALCIINVKKRKVTQ